ncbi:hypothetical protein Tcan_16079 [Toxocara canis]|uniref:Arrestin-like N-terminal domain-containing protein n=1 Tax=Toxocara canis TaxID=6265 RepID=A0A0B2V228_TOXCA|nr:hypothetical protein Tcan_16079 [Toxocara canis]
MLRKRYLDAEIKLTRLAFCPGEIICGMLLVDTTNDNNIAKMEVKLFGAAKVFCRDEEFAEHYNERPLFLHNEKILIDRNAIIYQKPQPLLIEIDDNGNDNEPLNGICPPGCHSDPSGLHAGRHGFAFDFQLPISGLETSFTSSNCPIAIKYHLIATIMNEDGVVLMECSQPITIVKPSHANLTRSLSANSATKCIDLKKWKGSLKYAHFNIVQRVSYTAQVVGTSHQKAYSKNIDLTGVGLPPSQRKILPGTSFCFSPQYYVPALTPSFEISDCMKVDYVAKLTVGRSPNEIFGDITIPLTIATHIDGAPS